MEIVSIINDGMLKARSLLLEMSIREYIEIGSAILHNNKYQRKRVQRSSTMYGLLGRDLAQLCTMPPIVLAFDDQEAGTYLTKESLSEDIYSSLKTDKLIILDGLQRTYTILSVDKKLMYSEPEREAFLNHIIRVELYEGLSKTGILYRMLTLNCGQTPMSKRHEIEILYSSYDRGTLNDIRFIHQTYDERKFGIDEYDFDDAIEGFNAYLNADETPIDKFDLQLIAQRLEKIIDNDFQRDAFDSFMSSYNNFVHRLDSLTSSWQYQPDGSINLRSVYGKDLPHFFCKSQTISAFGAAIGYLMEQNKVKTLEELNAMVNAIEFGGEYNDVMRTLIENLDDIRQKAPKIGIEQRAYLRLFFTNLFDNESGGFLNLHESVDLSFNQYAEKKWKSNTIETISLF